MSDLNPILELHEFVGQYSGHGINHDDQKFTGRLSIESIVGQRGISLSFIATGEDGTVFHEEHSTISPSMQEKLYLWNFNSNVPGLVPHEITEVSQNSDATKLIFSFNDTNDTSAFREVITLELFKNGDLGYHYAWGLPQGEFKERSGLRMSPTSQVKPDLF